MTRLALLCAIALAACDSDEPYETTMGAWCEIESEAKCGRVAACRDPGQPLDVEACVEVQRGVCCDAAGRPACAARVEVYPHYEDACMDLLAEASMSCPEVLDTWECERAWSEIDPS